MNRLEAGCEIVLDRMYRSAINKVNSLVKSGCPVLAVGRYSRGGRCILRVKQPEDYVKTSYADTGSVECIVPECEVSDLVIWVKKNYPDATIAL